MFLLLPLLLIAQGEKEPIILNIGGERFATSLATLRGTTGTLLEEMFREGSDTQCSPDGSCFIDRDPKAFGYVLQYLRNGHMLVESGDDDFRKEVLDEAEYFQLPKGVQDYLRWSSLLEGMDLSFAEFSFINKELNDMSLEMGGRLYQASKDGDSASTFHSRCDSKGATVVIVETTKGTVFGGFTDAAWSSSTGYSSSDLAFLFRLRPSIKRYHKKNGNNNAIYRNSGYGPTFGNGHDLMIATNCDDYATSSTLGGYAYDLPGYELNDGERYFRVRDYVVLQAKSM